MLVCPVCGGRDFVVPAPGQIRCTSQTIVDVVPPGLGGNAGSVPAPIYGQCASVRSEKEWARAGASAQERTEQARASEQQAAQERARQEQARKRLPELLALLGRAGNPGLVERLVPGEFHRRPFRRNDVVRNVKLEAAWPIGLHTWRRWYPQHDDAFERIATGYTPRGKFVPMGHACEGEPVHILLSGWSIGDRSWKNDHPPTTTVVAALEEIAARAGLT